MMGLRTHICTLWLLAAGASLAAPAAHAQATTNADSAAVIGVVQQFFDAIVRRDTSLARAVMVPGAKLSSMRAGAQASAVRHQTDTEFVGFLGTAKQQLLERMWSPSVRVGGDIASLWTPYDFHIDGKFSHCGVDVFELLRTPAGWRIVSVVYTVQMQGCVPSPLGPPKP